MSFDHLRRSYRRNALIRRGATRRTRPVGRSRSPEFGPAPTRRPPARDAAARATVRPQRLERRCVWSAPEAVTSARRNAKRPSMAYCRYPFQFDVLAVGVPVTLQRDRTRLASLGTDIGLVRDACVGLLTHVRECRRKFGHSRQLASGLCCSQQTADLALDFVVAPFSDPSPHQPPTIVEEIFRRPRVVPKRAPYGEVVVDGDWIGQSMVTNPRSMFSAPLPNSNSGACTPMTTRPSGA